MIRRACSLGLLLAVGAPVAAAHAAGLPVFISGTLRTNGGDVLAATEIRIEQLPSSCPSGLGSARPGDSGTGPSKKLTTSDGGIFAVALDQPQVVQLTVDLGPTTAWRKVVPVPRSLDLGDLRVAASPVPASERLRKGERTTTLTARDAISGAPIEGALVWDEADPRCWARTGADGTAGLSVSATGWGVAAQGFLEVQGVAPNAGRVALRKAAVSLAGRVQGLGDAGLAGALVELDSPRRALRTAPDGSFAFRDLPQRFPFEIRASASGLGPANRRITSARAPISLRLYPRRDVLGTVRDSAGKPVLPDRLTLQAGPDEASSDQPMRPARFSSPGRRWVDISSVWRRKGSPPCAKASTFRPASAHFAWPRSRCHQRPRSTAVSRTITATRSAKRRCSSAGEMKSCLRAAGSPESPTR